LAVGGIVLELLERSGVIKLPLRSRKLFEPCLDEAFLSRKHTKLPYAWDPERFKTVADAILKESGVSFMYHTKVVDVVVQRLRVTEVVVANKGGMVAIRPKVVIDCTGDADVAAWSGAPFEIDTMLQPMTTEFYLVNVDTGGDRQELVDKCAVVLADAHDLGRLDVYGGPWISSPAPGVVRANTVRLAYDSSNPDQLTKAEVEGREVAWRIYELWKEALPEFKDAYFILSGPIAGPRESRRIVGEYVLTKDDIIANRSFGDAIVKGAWYLDRHPAHTPGAHNHGLIKAYDIPYRSLLPKRIDNLLVAGRCHSATSEALASSRVGVTAMGMGQAAGNAAAVAVGGHVLPKDVDIAALRARLIEQGAVL